MSEKRKYTVAGSGIGKTGGTYTGKTPGQAARKAARSLLRDGNKKKVKFILREVCADKSNAEKKRHSYLGSKTELRPHVVRTLPNGETYTVKYKYSAKSCKFRDDDNNN